MATSTGSAATIPFGTALPPRLIVGPSRTVGTTLLIASLIPRRLLPRLVVRVSGRCGRRRPAGWCTVVGRPGVATAAAVPRRAGLLAGWRRVERWGATVRPGWRGQHAVRRP